LKSSTSLPSGSVFSGAVPVLFTCIILHELENALSIVFASIFWIREQVRGRYPIDTLTCERIQSAAWQRLVRTKTSFNCRKEVPRPQTFSCCRYIRTNHLETVKHNRAKGWTTVCAAGH
jgi:hypothetical protein